MSRENRGFAFAGMTGERTPFTVDVPVDASKQKLNRKGTLVEFFAQSPLVGSGIQIERIKRQPRNLAL